MARFTSEGFVLLLGDKEAWTPLPWAAVEEIPDLLRGRSWVPIGSTYSMPGLPWCLNGPGSSRSTGGCSDLQVPTSIKGTLDAHLKRFIARATAGYVVIHGALPAEVPARTSARAGWSTRSPMRLGFRRLADGPRAP